MSDRKNPHRKPQHVGSDSPGEEEAREQVSAGERGGPQEAKQPPVTPDQPAQTSGRRSARHEQAPRERKHFTEEERPSAQRDGEPSPDSLKKGPAQRGIGAKSGSHGAHTERTEEEAQKGPPADEHTRHGRQRVSGDRPGHRGSD